MMRSPVPMTEPHKIRRNISPMRKQPQRHNRLPRPLLNTTVTFHPTARGAHTTKTEPTPQQTHKAIPQPSHSPIQTPHQPNSTPTKTSTHSPQSISYLNNPLSALYPKTTVSENRDVNKRI